MEVLRVQGKTTLTWYRGDTKCIKILFREKVAGGLTSVQGMVVTFTAKQKFSEKKALEKTAILLGDYVYLNFTHDETKMLKPRQYVYDIELKKEDYSVVCTLYTGTLVIQADITLQEGD